MTHYQKLGVLALRLLSIVSIGLGVLGLTWYSLARMTGVEAMAAGADRAAGSIWYLLAGIALLVLSRPIGKALGGDL